MAVTKKSVARFLAECISQCEADGFQSFEEFEVAEPDKWRIDGSGLVMFFDGERFDVTVSKPRKVNYE